MDRVIVDTSAWIDFFRNKTGPVGDLIVELLEADRVVMTGPVLAELLQGVKSKKQAGSLNDLIAILPFEEVRHEDWEETGRVLRDLREKGVTISLTDGLIGVIAKRRGYVVLTLDKHFDHLNLQLL